MITSRSKSDRIQADHHWLALWLLLAGAVFLGVIGHESTSAGLLIGGGFVWLALVE